MKKFLLFILMIVLLTGCHRQEQEPMDKLIDRVMAVATEQYRNMDTSLPEGNVPRSVDGRGKMVTSDIYWWCSGFYPGTLWYLYEYSGNEDILQLAEKYTRILEPIQYVTNDHDVGFQLFCSYGNGYRLTQFPNYKYVLLRGAKSLSTRFNPVTGCIKSWESEDQEWQFPVIIDNLMNLELLLWCAQQQQDGQLYNIACSHADVTMNNHFRENYSCYHLVDYDTTDGKVCRKQTVQGAHNESSWARGQAWALYGYTMMYNYTQKETYLTHAKNIAAYLLKHPNMSEDGIPYWDFDAPNIPSDYRDASAAAVMASALLDLSQLINKPLKTTYIEFAEKQLRTLASEEYLATQGSNNNFLLKHSVGNLPGNSEIDKPLTYADYYFIEALLKYKKVIL